jgi:hypothetical protein
MHDIEKDLWKQNKLDRAKSKIIFQGGPADGQTFNIPHGVDTLEVEVEGAPATYVRSTSNTNVFVPYVN